MSLKNTYYVILFLSVFAALLLGLTIGKNIQKQEASLQNSQPTIPDLSPTATETPGIIPESSGEAKMRTATPAGLAQKGVYTNAVCGISLSYPDTVTAQESATQTIGAVFTNKTNPKDIIVLTCQKDIPKPPLAPENVETMAVGTISARLYHDSSAKDGSKVDALLFTNPKTGLDVFIGGYGSAFNAIIRSLKIL